MTRHTNRTIWLVVSVALFFSVWFIPLGGKYEPRRAIWLWLNLFSGEGGTASQNLAFLLSLSLLAAVVSLLLGWVIQFVIQFTARILSRKSDELPSRNASMRCGR